jgi:hypothetical protein
MSFTRAQGIPKYKMGLCCITVTLSRARRLFAVLVHVCQVWELFRGVRWPRQPWGNGTARPSERHRSHCTDSRRGQRRGRCCLGHAT